ncbi:MAG: ATP-binding protein, partial [Methanobrevibacter sp.]|nr:ATP-binding protein [Candidatus Methanovirga procula]
ADANRRTLQSFYLGLKNSDEYIDFIFITGISKFIHTSIFSKLNNPSDITLLSDYSTICGITHNELDEYCNEHIHLFADRNNMSYDEALSMINYWYDGYSFDGEKKVFNPFSTLSALKNNEFSHYWFSTGTPHFLVNILRNRRIDIDFENMELSETDLNDIDPVNIGSLPLLFQGGYLTVDKKFKNEMYETKYTLKIPNFEVKQAYEDNLKDLYVEEFKDKYTDIRESLWEDINNGKCDNLANRLQDDININPSYLNIGAKENWKIYESLFLLWMNIMGFDVTGEKLIKHGRIDGVFKDYDNNHVVICEVKYNQSSSKSLEELIGEALSQLKDRRYWMGYTMRKISLMAIVFKDEVIYDDKMMTLVKCRIEEFIPPVN